jgi:hypothetical protein
VLGDDEQATVEVNLADHHVVEVAGLAADDVQHEQRPVQYRMQRGPEDPAHHGIDDVDQRLLRDAAADRGAHPDLLQRWPIESHLETAQAHWLILFDGTVMQAVSSSPMPADDEAGHPVELLTPSQAGRRTGFCGQEPPDDRA